MNLLNKIICRIPAAVIILTVVLLLAVFCDLLYHISIPS